MVGHAEHAGLLPKIQCNDTQTLYDPATVEKAGESGIHDLQDTDSPSQLLSPSHYVARAYYQLPHRSAALSVSASSFVGRLLFALLPSFVQGWLKASKKAERVHPTAYLDGMRGLSAFAVFLCHYSYQCFRITTSYGQGAPGENPYLIQLPIVRLFYSGPPMVAIFFVISGYALSYKPLKQMRARSYDGLMTTLSSSVFRRAVRLFLPCIASTLVVFACVRMGLYLRTQPFYENRQLLRGHWDEHTPTITTTYLQFWHWYKEMTNFFHFWSWGIFDGSTIYDRHLWTVPVEFRASMVLFLSQLMVARMRPWLRIGTLLSLIAWGLRWDRWEMGLFWAGMILAELDQMRLARSDRHAASPLDGPPPAPRSWHTSHVWGYFWIANFVIALYLASYPDEAGDTSPGYVLLTTYIPKYYTQKHRFWQGVGAVQLVWATNNHAGLQALFTNGPVQYLGKLSFALYLMHGVVTHTFGYAIMPLVWAATGVDTLWDYGVGFVISGCLITAVLIWVSDVFWRAVDTPSVRLARWLEDKFIVKE